MADGTIYAYAETQEYTEMVPSLLKDAFNVIGKKFNYTISNESSKIKNTDNEVFLSPRDTGIIDVVNNFSWTSSPLKNSWHTIPNMYVTELKQKQNSLISSALYYINAISKSSFTDGLAKLIDQSCVDGLSSNLDKFKKALDELISQGADNEILTEYLKSYIGIYLTETTGFNYVFPFYEGQPHNIQNSWQSSLQSKFVSSDFLTEDVAGYASRAMAAVNIMAPGTYIEKPKYFHFPEEGESITVKFPLLNTVRKNHFTPYQQNYELLWILAFQNKPYRTSFSRINPPKLYTVSIPGIKYFPYAYISNMSVNFLGTRRRLPVYVPNPAERNGLIINPPIPEAYEVSITFTSLIADIGNLMVSTGFTDKVKVEERRRQPA